MEIANREQDRLAVHEEIARYVAEVAGSEADLDETLEAAAVEHLVETERA